MMDIIDHIGKASSIDDAIYASTDPVTARKIISLARYLLATDGQTLPGIQAWQYNHPLPYEDGITEDVYHDLFVQVGADESLQQSFFKHRANRYHGYFVLVSNKEKDPFKVLSKSIRILD